MECSNQPGGGLAVEPAGQTDITALVCWDQYTVTQHNQDSVMASSQQRMNG